MPKYGLYFDAFTTSTANKSAIYLYADATTERYEVIDLMMTGAGDVAAADTQHRALVLRSDTSSTGTGTLVTPQKFNEKSGTSAMATGRIEHSGEPATYVADSPLTWGFNQRGGMRWGVPQGEGIFLVGADTNDGLGFLVKSSAAGSVDGTMNWWEP